MEEIDPKFEVVGLYPLYGIKGAKLVMSAHIYIIDWDLDIRGFVVHHHVKPLPDDPRQQCEVHVPMGKNWDYEEKKDVKFPVISTMRGKWIHKVKEALLKEGAEKFKKFVFPEKFPTSYFAYLKTGKSKSQVKFVDDRPPRPPKEKRPQQRGKKPFKFKEYKDFRK